MRLAELLAQVHRELESAQRPAAADSFVLEGCEISLGVEIEAKGSGEVEFKVFGTGGKVGGEGSRTASHNMTFRFAPAPPEPSTHLASYLGQLKTDLAAHDVTLLDASPFIRRIRYPTYFRPLGDQPLEGDDQ